MGRRPENAEGEGAGLGLAAEQFGEVLKAESNRVGNLLDRRRVRFAPALADADHAFDARGGSTDGAFGAAIEAAAPGFAAFGPGIGQFGFRQIIGRPAAPWIDQLQRVANSRQPRNGVCVRRSGVVGRNRQEVNHQPRLSRGGANER